MIGNKARKPVGHWQSAFIRENPDVAELDLRTAWDRQEIPMPERPPQTKICRRCNVIALAMNNIDGLCGPCRDELAAQRRLKASLERLAKGPSPSLDYIEKSKVAFYEVAWDKDAGEPAASPPLFPPKALGDIRAVPMQPDGKDGTAFVIPPGTSMCRAIDESDPFTVSNTINRLVGEYETKHGRRPGLISISIAMHARLAREWRMAQRPSESMRIYGVPLMIAKLPDGYVVASDHPAAEKKTLPEIKPGPNMCVYSVSVGEITLEELIKSGESYKATYERSVERVFVSNGTHKRLITEIQRGSRTPSYACKDPSPMVGIDGDDVRVDAHPDVADNAFAFSLTPQSEPLRDQQHDKHVEVFTSWANSEQAKSHLAGLAKDAHGRWERGEPLI